MTARGPLALLFAAALLLSSPGARADEASGKQHFRSGVDLYDRGDYERALGEFRAAYDELHLYVIKRNIALTLRGLHRYAEAIESLEEYLAEGGDKIDAQLREAAEAAITEMTASVGTVRVTIDAHQATGAPPVAAVLTVDDQIIAADKAQLPLRVDASIGHTFRAHADGFADGVAPVTVTPGQRDVPVRLELVPITVTGAGTLRVRTALSTAVIRVDQGPPQQGEWRGAMRAGPHRVVVEAAGYARVTADIAVTPDALVDLPVTMRALAVAPPPPRVGFEAPLPRVGLPQRVRPWYAMAGLSLQEQTLGVGPGLEPGGARRTFGGAALTLKLGHMLAHKTNAHWAIEALVELGGYKASYPDPNVQSRSSDAQVGIFDWVVAPEIVYRSGGNLQFLMGTAAGLEGQVVDGTYLVNGNSVDVRASGVGGMWLVEAGAEMRFKRAFADLVGFFDLHWDGSLSGPTGERVFLDNPAARVGLRVMVGFPF